MSADTMPCGCLGHSDYEDLCRYPALETDRDEWKRRALERDLEVAREKTTREGAESSRDELADVVRTTRDVLGCAPNETCPAAVRRLLARAEQAEASRDAEMVLRQAAESAMDQLGREHDAEKVAREHTVIANAGLRDALRGLMIARPDEDAPCFRDRLRWVAAVGVAERALAADQPGDALMLLGNAVGQYQHRDETTLLETFRRLMDERARIAHMHAPEYVQALESLRDAVREYLTPTAPSHEHDLGPVRRALASVDALKEER